MGTSYRYDGDGERVVKCSGTYPSCSSATLYWKGEGSDALAETSWTGTISSEYVYFGGRRVARRDGTSNTPSYYFSDHLGSASVVSDANGLNLTWYDYYPYGGVAASGGSDPNRYKFNGKERDAESGLDNFGARYDASNIGRFMTPDWAAKPVTVPYANFGNPQSLNLYAYVENNPTTLGDPDGHQNGATNSSQGDRTLPYNRHAESGIDISSMGSTSPGDVSTDVDAAKRGEQARDAGNAGPPAQNNSSPRVADTVNSALQQPNLSNCLNTWIGPGLVLTNDNLPYMDATKSGTQLAKIAKSKDPAIEGTVKEPVPASGRSTVYVASEIMGDKNEAMRVYTHETGNALAMQTFAGGGRSGAYLGARGGPPGIEQSSGHNPLRDTDIGYQIEFCVFGPVIRVPGTTITVTGN